MKKQIIISFLLVLTFMVSGMNLYAGALDEIVSRTEVAECKGEFKVDGKSYTITLHDVSVWTCIKFKTASWFN